jgi:TatD DNase family protein
MGMAYAVVNGTSPTDWPRITKLAEEHSWIVPSYGVHPWYVVSLAATWKDELIAALDARPSAIGEVGIDHWKDGIDRALQERVFLEQLAIARTRNLPVTIHGLKAWEKLLELLTDHGAPSVGFLLHSYSGPEHLVQEFVRLGGYFSCAPSFLDPARSKKLSVFSKVPLDRLLPESDAPDQAPPPQLDRYNITNARCGRIHHPGNVRVVYEGLSTLLGVSVDELSVHLLRNFERLFGGLTIR